MPSYPHINQNMEYFLLADFHLQNVNHLIVLQKQNYQHDLHHFGYENMLEEITMWGWSTHQNEYPFRTRHILK